MRYSFSTWARFSVLTLVGLLALHRHGQAQSDLTSPYSIFGPGLVNQRQSVAQFSMGGSGAALFDPYRMSLINPAASAFYQEPIFETSGNGRISTFTTNVDAFENRSFELNNLSLSFPIKRGEWSLNVGLVPLTTVGYDVNVFEENDDATYLSSYFGDGGISQGYLGTGAKIYSRVDTANNVTSIAVGGQMNFNFGTVNNSRRLTVFDDPTALGFEDVESILVRDVNFEIGIQAQTNLKKRSISDPSFFKFLFGAVYAFGADLNAEQNSYAYNYRFSSGGSVVPRDTLRSAEQRKGSIFLPSAITIGTGFDWVNRKKTRLRLSADYAIQNWQDYEVNFEGDILEADFEQSTRYSIGLEWTPNISSTKYFKTIQYRAGFRYAETNLNLRQQQLEDIGMSFGLSLPINFRRGLTKSSFHIGAEVGEYGTTNDGLIREDYVRIMAGFSFTPHFRNRWFVQPKYD